LIDYLAIGVTHLLLLVALLRLLSRGDLDREDVAAPTRVTAVAPPPDGPGPGASPPPSGGVARLPRRPRGGGRA
jgi:hypothetical protein